MRRLFNLGLCLAACLAAQFTPTAATAATAAEYPDRPIRLVIPFPAGGGTDLVARIVANEMASILGQPVVVHNRGGANGILGADLVAKAEPDGYTVLMSTMGNLAINPSIYPDMPFDVLKDLAPVTQVVTVPLMLITHPSVPANTVAELIEYSKTQESPITYASSGTGGGPHLAGELFASATGAKMLHVPFKGSGPAYAALLAGHVQASFDSIVQGLKYVQSGQLKALALLSPERSALMPDLPTMAESIDGYDVTNWYGMMVPAETNPDTINKLQHAVAHALKSEKVRARLQAQGADAVASTPAQFKEFLNKEIAMWRDVVKVAGLEGK